MTDLQVSDNLTTFQTRFKYFAQINYRDWWYTHTLRWLKLHEATVSHKLAKLRVGQFKSRFWIQKLVLHLFTKVSKWIMNSRWIQYIKSIFFIVYDPCVSLAKDPKKVDWPSGLLCENSPPFEGTVSMRYRLKVLAFCAFLRLTYKMF